MPDRRAATRHTAAIWACRGFIVAVACLQLWPIGALLVASLRDGDSWGIGRAVAGFLAIPFALFTIPALFLAFRWKRPGAGAVMAAVSATASIVVWRHL